MRSAANPSPQSTAAEGIGEQAILPLSVILEIVLQGLRIRLGRSIVTILGVALGIAFLMSILTNELVRAGVKAETDRRADVSRMLNFLIAETGPLRDRNIAVFCSGTPDDGELRLVRALRDAGVAQIRFAGQVPPPLASLGQRAAGGDAVDNAAALVIIGPVSPSSETLASLSRPKLVIAATRGNVAAEGVAIAALARPVTPDETARALRDAKLGRYRSAWIISISLLVTVIGISNAMLMSVTERFREIGTMKCLGALSSFIRRLFLVESTIIGAIGAAAGVIFGLLLPIAFHSASYGFSTVVSSVNWGSIGLYGAGAFALGLLLSSAAALYPARFASRMVPATALRTSI